MRARTKLFVLIGLGLLAWLGFHVYGILTQLQSMM